MVNRSRQKLTCFALVISIGAGCGGRQALEDSVPDPEPSNVQSGGVPGWGSTRILGAGGQRALGGASGVSVSISRGGQTSAVGGSSALGTPPTISGSSSRGGQTASGGTPGPGGSSPSGGGSAPNDGGSAPNDGGSAPNDGGSPTTGGTTSLEPVGPTLVTLASGQYSPYQLTKDDDYLYWSNWGNFSTSEGAVMKLSLKGGTPIELVPAVRASGGIAVDKTSVYFSAVVSDRGTLLKVPIAGGAVTQLAVGVVNDPITVTATGVIGLGTGGLVKVPLEGGAIQVLAPLGSSYGFTADNDSVYWTTFIEPCVVSKVPVGGGDVTVLASVSAGLGGGIAVDSVNAYFITRNAVMKVALDGGPVTTLSTVGGTGIAIDETSVYWTDFSSHGSVRKVSKQGGETAVLATEQDTPSGIVVDATSVYWVNAGSGIRNGSVMKLSPK